MIVGEVKFLGDLITAAADKWGARDAIVNGEATFSFNELDQRSAKLADALLGLGVKPGDRIVLYGENGWQWVVAYYGMLKAGAVAVPVNMMLTSAELSFVVADSGATLLIASVSRYKAIDAAACQAGLTRVVYGGPVDDNAISFEYLIDRPTGRSRPISQPGSLAAICYTSGTTGWPKGAMLSHQSLLHNARSTALMHGRSASDVIVTALPLTHVYGNAVMNSAMLSGAMLVIFPMFDAAKILATINQHRATMFEGVPTMYYYLLDAMELGTTDLSSLRLCTVGGQTMPATKMAEVEKHFGCPLIELWGMTELSGLGTTHPHLGPYRHGSIGTALPFVEAKIAPGDDPAASLSAGEPGELLVRGPIVMQGYWNSEAATREAITPDGWLRTGDIAIKDADGFISIVDRKKDMILTAGYNVYPAEIERVIAEYPDVAMVGVAGAPDAARGEIAVAYVVPRANMALVPADIIAYCRTRLAAYKIPRRVEIVADLPKTSTGKIMRRALAETKTTVHHGEPR